MYPATPHILNLLLNVSIEYLMKSKIYIDILKGSPMQWHSLELQRSLGDPGEF